MRLPALIVITLTLALSACAFSSEKARSFEHSTLAYERALRWGDLNTVMAFHRGQDTAPSEKQRKRFKQIHVSRYETIYARAIAQNETEQLVELSYYFEDQAVEHTITLKQHWQYDPKREGWYLTSPMPDFR
jgi:hypothetical protein